MTNPTPATLTSDSMDDGTFKVLSGEAIAAVVTAIDAHDPDVVEANVEAEVLKIVFPAGLPYVLNVQRPLRELWLAADRRAWHFRYEHSRWVCKKSGDELFSTVKQLVADRAHVALAF